ncbi:MAG: 50S ribosomal protein L32, partial [Actinophytocola sp.]|nr:50S ribosomal protein L32 [Actinophytocola sp.]
MAVPKRKKSRANTRARRSQWKATAPDLVPIVVAGERMSRVKKLAGFRSFEMSGRS